MFKVACPKSTQVLFYTKEDLSFSIRKDLFFFVSQRKNAIITRFVKYGGLEQILILISEIEV